MIDLRQLLDERSANPPSPNALRRTLVRRRIARRRRKRIAAVAAVAFLLFGGYLLRPALDPDPVPPLSAYPFPQWVQGARLVGATSVPLQGGRASITWTPASLDIVTAVSCGQRAERPTVAVLATGPRPIAAILCGEGISSSRYLEETPWQDAGIRVGEPVTLTATSDNNAAGTLSFAVYERVPFADYPLPSRPSALKSLDCTFLAGMTPVRSEPGDPLRAVSVTIEWSHLVSYHVRAQTPGLLRIRVEGLTVSTAEFWDYEAREVGSVWHRDTAPLLKPGDRVTVTLTPEHFTGAWVFWTYPSDQTWSTDCPH